LAVTELNSVLHHQRRATAARLIVATGRSLDKPAEETPVLAERRQPASKGDLVLNRTEYVAQTKESSP
jgi:hypothetical protein